MIIEELSFKVPMNSNPRVVKPRPINVRISDPILSDKYPLRGDINANTIGDTIRKNPVEAGESFKES